MKTTILLLLLVTVVAPAWQMAVSSYDEIPSLSGILCQVHLGEVPLCSASSCKEIVDTRPLSAQSGIHWLTDGTQSIHAHCLTSIAPSPDRGWMLVGEIESALGCPPGLIEVVAGGKKLCAKAADTGCSSVIFPTRGISYSRVCGWVYGYNTGTPDGTQKHTFCPGCTIDEAYVDGVSITHGSPRQHIWSLAAGFTLDHCPCSGATIDIPSFVGGDYFCDVESTDTFVESDRLWDGMTCIAGAEACCAAIDQAGWFCADLPEPTTDDIEFRVCADEPRINEDVYIEWTKLYVQ